MICSMHLKHYSEKGSVGVTRLLKPPKHKTDEKTLRLSSYVVPHWGTSGMQRSVTHTPALWWEMITPLTDSWTCILALLLTNTECELGKLLSFVPLFLHCTYFIGLL